MWWLLPSLLDTEPAREQELSFCQVGVVAGISVICSLKVVHQ